MPDSELPDEPSEDEKPLGRDDRVSLWPLSFEEVMRALLRTPRIKREPDSGDQGRDEKP